MIRVSICIAIFLFLGLTQISLGQEMEIISKSYRSCIEENIATTENALQCTQKAFSKYELLMNEKLFRLKEMLTEKNSSSIEENHTAWEKWILAELDFYTSLYQELYEGGTLTRIVILNKKIDLYKNRIRELENRIELFKQ